MNEPSASLWKKLNEVSDRLQKVSEQLIETNAINKSYHQALDHQRVKVESLEEQNNKAQGGYLNAQVGDWDCAWSRYFWWYMDH